MLQLKKLSAFYRNRHNRIALLILAVSIVVGASIIYDPLNIRKENNILAFSEETMEDLSKQFYEVCAGENPGDRQDCYSEHLKKITSSNGLRTGIAVLHSLQDKDGFARSCHIISHRMADAAYHVDPRDFSNMLDTVDVSLCGGGFLHGIISAYADEHPEITIDTALAEDLCKNGNTYRRNSCMHFMGHMFIIDAFDDLDKALPFCEGIQKEFKFNCYDGIFMENHQKLMLAEHGISPLPVLNDEYIKKLEDYCLKSKGVVATACWTEMAEIYAHTYRYDPAVIFSHCSKAQQKEYADACYLKGVNAMAIYPGFDTTEKLVSLCSPYNKSATHYQCSYTLLSALIYNSPKFTPRATTYCSGQDTAFKNQCYFLIGDRLKAVVEDVQLRTPYCNQLPEEYRSSCIL